MRVFFLTNACQFTKELRERQILRGLGLAAILTLIAAGHLQQVGKLPTLSFGHASLPLTNIIIQNTNTDPSLRADLSTIKNSAPSIAVGQPSIVPVAKVQQANNVPQLPIKWSLEKGSVSNTFNTSAHLAGLTPLEITQLSHIFANKIDFRHLRKGDSFQVITERHLSLNPKQKIIDNIIGADLVVAGHHYTAIRYVSKSGQMTYLQPDGTGLTPGFLRYPLHYTRIGSGFNLHRLDPVTGVYHAHPAIDFDAPMGTPIQATGDGKVNFAGYVQGYGNVVKIDHSGQVMTLYAHMRNFAKGIHSGTVVSKGQIIGYVGMSGYTTGPHVHYELHFGSKPVNPLTVKLPSATALSAQDRTSFGQLVNKLKPFLS